jgi:AbrB family looped-hinge helix DNA binding protein
LVMGDTSPIRVGPKGRIVLPADVRRALGINEGDELMVILGANEVTLMTREALFDRIHQRFAHVEGSMADELIAERRAEATRERAELEEL